MGIKNKIKINLNSIRINLAICLVYSQNTRTMRDLLILWREMRYFGLKRRENHVIFIFIPFVASVVSAQRQGLLIQESDIANQYHASRI